MSLIPLPIRLAPHAPAAASSPSLQALREETSTTPEDPPKGPSSFGHGPGPGPGPGPGFGRGLGLRPDQNVPSTPLLPSPLVAENGDIVSYGHSSDVLPFRAPPDFRIEAAAGSTNHQFWLKDAKIAEDLFTIHRSAKHLLEFTSSMLGSHDPSLGHRPIPVMSDADVLFMTQLSNDIARGVGGISAMRHHGLRARKRKARDALVVVGGDGGATAEPRVPDRENASPHHRHSRGSRDGRTTSSKRLQVSKDGDDDVSCQKCGRTETPEWRRGPEGLLCNVCGLMYAKQRRKLKGR